MPMPRAASPSVAFQALWLFSGGRLSILRHGRSPFRYFPARGGGRSAGRLGLPRADVAAWSEVGGSSLDLDQVSGQIVGEPAVAGP